jgi:hypothetical protein
VKKNVVIVAHVQAWMFFLTMAGFIFILITVVLGLAKLDATTEKLAYTMLGSFATILSQQGNYFYARQRAGTGTITDGDGETNPVSLPPAPVAATPVTPSK